MAKDTKERIMAAALDMFSQNGYAGTNIRELTASLGLVARKRSGTPFWIR